MYIEKLVRITILKNKHLISFPENGMTVAELEPLTIRSGGSSIKHYATKKWGHQTGLLHVYVVKQHVHVHVYVKVHSNTTCYYTYRGTQTFWKHHYCYLY